MLKLKNGKSTVWIKQKDNNLIFIFSTQRIETTETLWKSAYGPNSPFAIFNVATPKYCKSDVENINNFKTTEKI